VPTRMPKSYYPEFRRKEPSRVARQLGVGLESLRSWVKQAEVDTGARGGLTTAERDEFVEQRKKIRYLQRAHSSVRDSATARLGAAS
jgi:transposase